MRKLKRLLTDRRGSEAVSFLLTTAMLLCIFATIVTAFVYISQSYNAAYLCHKVTRQIEVTGVYDRTVTFTLTGTNGAGTVISATKPATITVKGDMYQDDFSGDRQ